MLKSHRVPRQDVRVRYAFSQAHEAVYPVRRQCKAVGVYPKRTLVMRFDQRSQFSSYDWQAFLAAHNLQPSMSRRGDCHDNPLAESLFKLLKRERIRRKIYLNREEGESDVFDYSAIFYNPKLRHSFAGDFSPVEYQKQYFQRLESV